MGANVRPYAAIALSALAPGVPRGVSIETSRGKLDLIIDRGNDYLRAFINRCPHRGTPLDWIPDQFLTPDGASFICGTHGARFRRTDGYCETGPCRGSGLKLLSCRIEGGQVLVLIPEAAP